MEKFKPAKNQTDYTNIHWCPIVNYVLEFNGKILIVQRNKKLNFYPNYWNGISEFLDDKKSLIQKIKTEIREEVKIEAKDIASIKLCRIFHEKAPKYNKIWIVHPILVRVKNDKIKLDWEAQDFRWISIEEIKNYRLLPGFSSVIKEVKKNL